MKLVLLDRDGVINEDREDCVKSPGELVMIPGVPAAIRRLNEAHLYVAVVTNQSVVGRGLISEEDLRHIHEKMMTELAKEHARVHHIFFAPDHPDRPTLRRKPGPQMLLEAMNHYHVPARDTVMVGDTLTDLMAAKAAGCRSILVRTGKGARTVKEGIPPDMAPVFIAKHLADAAPRIVEMLA